ncbi:hypothetical protein TNCV_2781071 [Trichonephila clavipes]|nr:hypothetical protein TNCV_2781071 [Trichonephila clavipes]
MRHRSGIAIIKSERKRHEKIGGSIKCGKTYPAFMTSIREQQQEAIKIIVEYQSVHAGHEMEVGKLGTYLHGDDRRNLAALLKAGVPSTKIIEDIQNKCLPTERLGLLTKKDLHNKFPYTVENVSNETTLTIEDSNHLRREKEAILREKESLLCVRNVQLVYERIRRRTQFINTAASVASTEEMKCLDQCLEDLMKHMGYSEFGSSSLRSIENFPAPNRYIIKQWQKRKIPDL